VKLVGDEASTSCSERLLLSGLHLPEHKRESNFPVAALSEILKTFKLTAT
jgi:hypothetical protein